MTSTKYIIGIDEAGRGPLAGPVSVGSVLINREKFKKMSQSKFFKGLRDSKKLSHKQRLEWYQKLLKWKKEGILKFSCSMRNSKMIDQKGISKSIFYCINSCLNSLEKKYDENICDKAEVFLDGSLKAPIRYKKQKTYIGGDDKFKIIALASIVAKVRRDKTMCKMAKIFPLYKFEINKGYGTEDHIKTLKKKGVCEIHRLSFLKNI